METNDIAVFSLPHLFVILLAPLTVSSLPERFNSSLVCLRGFDRSPYLDLECYRSDVTYGLIAVTRVTHGLTPISSGCDVTAPRDTCCPEEPDPARECLFSSLEELTSLRSRCDGLVTCSTSLDRASVNDRCPTPDNVTSYGRYSDFAQVEYMCVSSDAMINVCDVNTTLTGSHVILESNFFHDNGNQGNETCSCVVTTACTHSLLFQVLTLRLAKDGDGRCRESVTVTEGEGGGVIASFNCSHDPSLPDDGVTTFTFSSQASVAMFDLDLEGNHTGSLMILVTATNRAPVEVLCGQPASQALLNDNHCSAIPAPPPAQIAGSPTFNTSEACLTGRDITQDFEISCLGEGAPGIISVDRVLYGVTPDVMGCDVTAPRDKCCPGYDPARDCVFSSLEGLGDLRKKCDGSTVCYPTLRKADVTNNCPDRRSNDVTLTYDAYSHFAMVEYSCINTGLLSDVCSAGSTTQNAQVYVDSNVFHLNTERHRDSCLCHVTAPCRHTLDVTLMTLQLTSSKEGDCQEEVVVEDGINRTLSVTLNCSHNHMDEGRREVVFTSQSNFLVFSLHLASNHTGKLLFRVTASEGATVEARCGRTTELPLWDQHLCHDVTQNSPSSDSVTSTPLTSTMQATNATTDTVGGVSVTGKGGNTEDSLPLALVIGLACLLLILIIIAFLIVFIVWRNRKRNPPSDDDDNHYIVRYAGPDPEPLDIHGPYTHHDPYDNNNYYDNVANTAMDARGGSEKHVYTVLYAAEGAVGGVDNPVYYTGIGSPEKDRQMMEGEEGAEGGVVYTDVGSPEKDRQMMEGDEAEWGVALTGTEGGVVYTDVGSPEKDRQMMEGDEAEWGVALTGTEGGVVSTDTGSPKKNRQRLEGDEAEWGVALTGIEVGVVSTDIGSPDKDVQSMEPEGEGPEGGVVGTQDCSSNKYRKRMEGGEAERGAACADSNISKSEKDREIVAP